MTWRIKDHSYKRKHGESSSTHQTASREYASYISAKSRCQSPTNASFQHYGGRGIEFRFVTFAEFLECLGRRPGSEYSLDRIDVNGHYEPGNVRWATQSQQQLNKTVNRKITHNDETLTDTEWSRRLGMVRNGVRERLRAGWCEKCSVSIPKQSLPGRYAVNVCRHRHLSQV